MTRDVVDGTAPAEGDGGTAPDAPTTTALEDQPEQALPAFGAADSGSRRPVLKALIAINVVVSLVTLVMIIAADGFSPGAILFDGISPLHEWAEMHGPAVDGGEVWRLVTAMFLHYGLAHLLVNMVMLGLAGWKLEPILGSRRFLALYLLCGFGASVATYYADHASLTAGASGANFGVFAALLLVCLRLRRNLWLPAILVAFGVITTFTIPGMAIAAHIAGLVLGAALAAGYAYPTGPRRATVQLWVPLGTLLVLVTLMAIGIATA